MLSSFRFFALAGAALLLGAAPAHAVVIDIDFEGHANGLVIDDEYAGAGISIIVENFNKDFGEADDALGDDPDWGVIFDTRLTGTADGDLEGPLAGSWNAGNIDFDEVLGNVLIIQENFDSGCNGGTLCDTPDDEGARPAGRIIFDSESAIESFGFDLIDIDSTSAEAGAVVFYQGGVAVGSIPFSSFAGVTWGNNSANRIAPLDATDIGLAAGTTFDRVAIELGGSGATDNIVLNVAPEPSTALLTSFGLFGLAWLGSRERSG